MNAPVTLTRHGSIGLIVIDNPPVNALSQAVRSGLVGAVNELNSDAALQAGLLLCRGRTFIAGADIAEFGKAPLAPHLPDVVAHLETSAKLMVAAIHGTALGGGFEIALGCHYRCALPDAKIGFPEVKLGILPGAGGTQRTPRLTGVERALELILSGDPIGAARAHEWRLIDELIEGDLESGALGYTRRLLAQHARQRRIRDLAIPQAQRALEAIAAARARIAKQSRGQIAPERIVRAVEASVTSPFEEGLRLERKLFEECRQSTQSAALRHLFFAERETARVPGLPADITARSVASVGVVGAGTMGAGIALNCLNAGLAVTLVEQNTDALERGRAHIASLLESSVQKGRLTTAERDQRLARLEPSLAFDALADADLIIEAVFESMEVKREVFGRLDRIARTEAILATNTSTLDVDEIAGATRRPREVVGLHFFSPAHVMRLIEIVRGRETSALVLATALAFARRLGKVGVVVGNAFGFVGNRMLYAYGRENQLLMLEGAAPQDVDRALQEFGMAMGPNAVGDLAGLDIGYKARRELKTRPDDPRWFRVSDALVEQGRLGQKTGVGFYRYEAGSRTPVPDPDVLAIIRTEADKLGIAQRSVTDEEIVERCTLALVNEGARILGEGLAMRSSDIDVIWALGYGFPRYRGGPMFYADTLGLDAVRDAMRRLASRHGAQHWQLAPLLEQLANEAGTFSARRRN
ncbi:MAG TPA: 3-hydroxyacyl-CoA dehydrogenase NAD-binding domain-containing protein [Steroidobacteraceae bacterium]|nr:3-hydroxyacyl-CoA dehydrogenase NAD-binding domain-containing protein [Steroidobacteraceae bacterium]